MKIIINKTGKVEDVTDKIASRLINKGKAHLAQMGGVIEPKIGNTVLFETLPEITEENIDELKTSEPIKKPKRNRKKKVNGKNQYNNPRKRRSGLF